MSHPLLPRQLGNRRRAMAEVEVLGIGTKAARRALGRKWKAGEEWRDGEKGLRKRGDRMKPPRVMSGSSSSAIQRLFEVCRAVFKGPGTVPASRDVEILQLLLDTMKPADFGLSTDLPDLLSYKGRNAVKGTPTISFSNIHICDNFSMCIFFLPPTAVIPLHNHPEMTVFSKLLFGKMHIKSYDWIEKFISDENPPSAKARPARLVLDSNITAPCKTSILYPTTGGNIHSFRAITVCAVLDIQGPPYSKQYDRDCAYYRDYSFSDAQVGGCIPTENGTSTDHFGWLEEIDMPKDLKMHGIEYLGPQIVEA